MEKVLVDGKLREMLRDFGGGRALVRLDGVPVLVDAFPVTGDWMLSGEPAREGEEKEALKEFTVLGTTVEVTKPDGSSDTFKDE